MFKTVDHATADLFDPWAYLGEHRRQMLQDSWAGLFRDKVLPYLPVGPVAACFHNSLGRPSKDLYVAVGCLVLQPMHDLSDAATVQALAFDLTWQFALDVRRESDCDLNQRTLRNYRSLIIEHQLDQQLFQAITDRLAEVFAVDCTHQRIDSTALQSNMRKLGRLGTFTETLGRFLRELANSDAPAYQQLDPTLQERYLDGGKKECFGLGGKPSQAAQHLQEVAGDLLMLVRRFAGTAAAQLPAYALLQRLLSEHCQVQEEQGQEKLRVIDAKAVGGNSLQNPSDPQATYNGHKGAGYLMQVMETYRPQKPAEGQPDLITHVSLNPMTQPDSQALVPALEDVARRGLAPQQVLGDTHYGLGDNAQQAAEQGVELISPAMPPKGSVQGKLSLEHFVLDERGLVVQCPAGHRPISTSRTPKNCQARFDAGGCACCPLRPNCPVQKPRQTDRQATRLQYDRPRLEMFQRRKAEAQESFKKAYRWRAGIEATMSRLKYQVGLGYLRVRGLAAVTYKAFMAALSLNIWRCAAV